MLRLVHDLKTNTYEHVDFQPVETSNRPRLTEHFDNQLVRSLDFVDHTDSNNKYQSLRRHALTQAIHSWDVSDNVRPVFSNPCYDLAPLFRRNGDFGRHMKRSYLDIAKNQNERQAFIEVQAANARLTEHTYSAAMSDEDICQLAKAKSRSFAKQILSIEGESHQFAKACELLESLGLSFREELIAQKSSSGELYSLVNRVCDEIFLRRQLRKKCAFTVEQVARDLALVQAKKQVYCSDFSILRQRERIASNEQVLENTIVFDEDDLENWFTIAELSKKSISNPELRRGEMFTRLRGFEEIAQESDHEAVFYTNTAPSRFHPVSKGEINPKWLKAGKPTAKQAHNHLINVWQELGKIVDKKDIKVYGMRIAEPHQDGTPHHHFLLFMRPEHRETVTNEFKRLAMQDSPSERGAKKYRFTAKVIDWKKGSAIGYVAKYLSKNIDGQHIDSDKGSRLNGIEAAERVVTWARVNQIRQFQFIGGPSVTVWREMRRLRDEFKEDSTVLSDITETEHYMLEKIRKAADVGDWKDFCGAMGGVFVKRKDQPVRVQYNAPDAIEKLLTSGEFSPTRFGDAAQGRVSGLLFKNVFLATRFRNWKTQNKEQFLAAQKTIMKGTADFFDALEAEAEYTRMAEERYAQYEEYVAYIEELQALVLLGDIEGACLVGAAPPDMRH
ncbi:replication endonuclease [Vibrio ostreicida]|uniref:replication endonuclease n=1 Tax=Vibrio ostreicida TaxID=526588 RepID=UPI0009707220|nr:replication endonuclease [Vibrio ostreicida]